MISVGLLVDFLMHILLRYNESTHRTRDGRVRDTLETMGSSILLGGLSTFLGIFPLFFSTSYILKTVFTSLCSMVIIGVTHGLILLPVILSMAGPIPKEPKQIEKLEEKSGNFTDDSSDCSPKKLKKKNSSGSLNTLPPTPDNKSSETIESFLLSCAEVKAKNACPDNETAAREEKAALFDYYVNIYKTTSSPAVFLGQLGTETNNPGFLLRLKNQFYSNNA